MREYIEEWLRKPLIKIIELDQQETVVIVMPPPTQESSTKEAPTNK